MKSTPGREVSSGCARAHLLRRAGRSWWRSWPARQILGRRRCRRSPRRWPARPGAVPGRGQRPEPGQGGRSARVVLEHASCSAPGGPGGGPGPRGRSSAGAGTGDHHGAGQRDQVQYQDADSGRSLAQGVLDDAAGIELATARMTTLPLVCCSTQGRCRRPNHSRPCTRLPYPTATCTRCSAWSIQDEEHTREGGQLGLCSITPPAARRAVLVAVLARAADPRPVPAVTQRAGQLNQVEKKNSTCTRFLFDRPKAIILTSPAAPFGALPSCQ